MCVAQLTGMGASAGGSMLQGQQNADTLNGNAELLDMKAEDSLKRGGVAEDIQRNKTSQVAGAQRAGMGASGVVVDSGSGAKVLGQTAAMGEMDAQTIRSNAMREAWGYTTQAEDLRTQAVAAGTLQRLLLPGSEGGSVKDVLGQQLIGGNPLKLGQQKDYISSGKYNSGGVGKATSSYVAGTGWGYKKAGV